MSTNPIGVLPMNTTDRPKVAVLLNMNARVVTPKVIRCVQQVVPPSDLYASRSLSDAERIVADVLRKGYDTVLTGGGDGTFVGFLGAFQRHASQHEHPEGNTVRALAPQKLPRMGVLKLGTGNALAGLSGASPLSGGGMLEDILHLRAGRIGKGRRLDLVEVDGICAPFAGFGYDALILNNYVRFKKLVSGSPLKPLGEGLTGYALSISFLSVPQAALKKFPDVEVRNAGAPARRIDDDGNHTGAPIPEGGLLYKGPARFVSAGTCPNFGFNFKVFPFAGKQPARMHLRVACTGVAQALWNLPAIWQGKWRSPTFHDFFVERIHVKCDGPMPLQVGGDAKGYHDELTMGVMDRPIELIDFSNRS